MTVHPTIALLQSSSLTSVVQQEIELQILPGEFAGNRKLTAIYRRLIKELSLFRRMNLADGKLLPISANEHRAIVKAIASGDREAAGRAMREHVMESKERTERNNAPQPVRANSRKVRHA